MGIRLVHYKSDGGRSVSLFIKSQHMAWQLQHTLSMRTLTIAITSYMHVHDYNIQANTLQLGCSTTKCEVHMYISGLHATSFCSYPCKDFPAERKNSFLSCFQTKCVCLCRYTRRRQRGGGKRRERSRSSPRPPKLTVKWTLEKVQWTPHDIRRICILV